MFRYKTVYPDEQKFQETFAIKVWLSLTIFVSMCPVFLFCPIISVPNKFIKASILSWIFKKLLSNTQEVFKDTSYVFKL